MIEIDGSYGEGGGQVLRTALTMSMLTGKEMRIVNIRVGRKKPGLRPQHLKAVEASAKISHGVVEGAGVGALALDFAPGEIRAGKYQFDIGTAGATSLVLQTIFLPLSLAQRKTSVMITGGTHVPWSPCYHYLAWQWLAHLGKLGFDANLSMELAGFYPRGGGCIHASIQPICEIQPLNLTKRGNLIQVRGLSAVANLPSDIAKRQRQRVVARLGANYPLNDIRTAQLPSRFKGTVMLLLAEFEHGRCCYFGLGAPGKRAEVVADDAIDSFEQFMVSDGAIDQYLADQLLLPLAFATGPSILRTSKVTQHLLTNAEIIRKFLPVEIEIDGLLNEPGRVSVVPKGHDSSIT